jgi:hypothetical protein
MHCEMLAVNDRILLSMQKCEEMNGDAQRNGNHLLVSFHKVPIESDTIYGLNSLGQIYWFSKFCVSSLALVSDSTLVLCAGQDDQTLSICSFLLGSYLILMENVSEEKVIEIFKPVTSRFQGYDNRSTNSVPDHILTVIDGWRAIHNAKTNGWLDFKKEEVDIDRCIDMQEYLHYDNPANGVLHVIVPSQLIAFRCPTNLSAFQSAPDANCHWLDVGGQRHFSPLYYADILGEDFDVEVVVRCDTGIHDPASMGDNGQEEDEDEDEEDEEDEDEDEEDEEEEEEEEFGQRGIMVERLTCLGSDGPLTSSELLHDVDRFLTLTWLSPGPVAIHGREGTSLGNGGEVLVLSLLMQRHGFDARSALAWLRMCHPPAPPRLPAFFLLDEAAAVEASAGQDSELDAHERRRAWRTNRRFGSSAPALLSSRNAPVGSMAMLRRSGSGRGAQWLAQLLADEPGSDSPGRSCRLGLELLAKA